MKMLEEELTNTEKLYQSLLLNQLNFDEEKIEEFIAEGILSEPRIEKYFGESLISLEIKLSRDEKKCLNIIKSFYQEDKTFDKSLIKSINSYSKFPLLYFALLRHWYSVADFLIDNAGLDVNFINEKSGKDLLYILAERYIKTEKGISALADKVEYLIKRGANPLQKNNQENNCSFNLVPESVKEVMRTSKKYSTQIEEYEMEQLKELKKKKEQEESKSKNKSNKKSSQESEKSGFYYCFFNYFFPLTNKKDDYILLSQQDNHDNLPKS